MWMIFPLVFLAGFVDSISGGGALISIPAYMAVGLPPHMALGTNKMSAVLGTGMSTARFVRKGYVNWTSAVFAFCASLVGSVLGARLALYLDERTLTYIMLAIVPCLAVFIFMKKDLGTKEKELPTGRLILYSIPVGFVLGGYDGFFGPCAGTFMILAFTMLLGFDLLTACGNTKVVNFASNLAAVVTFFANGSVNYKLGIPCAFCAVLGSYIGSGLALKNGAKIVRPMMLVVVALLLAKIVWDYFIS